MATLRLRNKKWQVQVRQRNYGSISKTFIHKKDAVQWAKEQEIELQKNSIKLKVCKFPITKTLIEKYINNISIKKKGYDFEKYCFNNFLRTNLSNLPINLITTNHLAEYRDERLKKINFSILFRLVALLTKCFPIKNHREHKCFN